MLAGCQFTFCFSSSKRCLPTWEEAESCNGNMMTLLSVSFSFFYPLCMSHPYLLLSGSLAWGQSASCRLVRNMRHSPRTTSASQRKLLPLRQTGECTRSENPQQCDYCTCQLERAEMRRFSKENWRLWGSFHRKLKNFGKKEKHINPWGC